MGVSHGHARGGATRRRKRRRVRPEDEQLRRAREMQDILLPPFFTSLPQLEVASRFLPSRAVGGDFCDYFAPGNRYLGIYLGDVEGKGLQAAMYALLVSGLMRGLHKTNTDPASVVAFLNRRLSLHSLPGNFCCLNYAVFDLEKGRLSFANAGLPYPMLLRQGRLTRIELPGIPLGLFNPCQYDQVVLDLQPGDCLLLYTDGLPDSLEEFRPREGDGEKQVQNILRGCAGESARELADRLVKVLRPPRSRGRAPELPDDATFLVVRLLG